MKKLFLCFLLFQAVITNAQSDPEITEIALPKLEHFVGYYDVGVQPNKPFFRCRIYLREEKLYVIFDSDIDRPFNPVKDGKWNDFILLSSQDVPNPREKADDTYYWILDFDGEKLKGFKVLRPRSEWPTDLYAYRNEKLSELAVYTEQSLIHHYETAHFDFYYSDLDTGRIAQMAEESERKYAELVKFFKMDSMPKTTFRIYPDVETYHNAVLTPKAPAWQMGKAWLSNEIRMVSPIHAQGMTNDSMLEKIHIHEYVHCLHWTKLGSRKNIKQWLWEGIAMMKGCCRWAEPKDLKYLVKGKKYSLKKIESNNELKYELGYYLVEFILEKWGEDKLLALIEVNGDVEAVFKLSIKSFERQFYQYLDEKYFKR